MILDDKKILEMQNRLFDIANPDTNFLSEQAKNNLLNTYVSPNLSIDKIKNVPNNMSMQNNQQVKPSESILSSFSSFINNGGNFFDSLLNENYQGIPVESIEQYNVGDTVATEVSRKTNTKPKSKTEGLGTKTDDLLGSMGDIGTIASLLSEFTSVPTVDFPQYTTQYGREAELIDPYDQDRRLL